MPVTNGVALAAKPECETIVVGFFHEPNVPGWRTSPNGYLLENLRMHSRLDVERFHCGVSKPYVCNSRSTTLSSRGRLSTSKRLDGHGENEEEGGVACLAHAITYTLPFLLLTTSWKALLVISVSHFVIDHWRLARYLCWIKNYLAPKWIKTPIVVNITTSDQRYKWGTPEVRNYPWSECVATGYHKDRPVWLTVWLMIITDNTMHFICNGLALKFLGS